MDGWTGHHAAGDGGDAPGDVGEELRLLGLALLDRVEPRARSVFAGLRVEAAQAAVTTVTEASGTARTTRAEATAEAAGGDGPARAAGASGARESGELPAACQWCPLCSAVALLRGEAPELGGRIAERGDALLTMLRSLLERPAGEEC